MGRGWGLRYIINGVLKLPMEEEGAAGDGQRRLKPSEVVLHSLLTQFGVLLAADKVEGR